MKVKFSSKDFEVLTFSAKENRNWRYYNLPWSWEATGIDAFASFQKDQGFETQIFLPEGTYESLERGAIPMRGRLLTRVSFRKRIPFRASHKEKLQIQVNFQYRCHHGISAFSRRFVTFKHRLEWHSSYKLIPLPQLDAAISEWNIAGSALGLKQSAQQEIFWEAHHELPMSDSYVSLFEKRAPEQSHWQKVHFETESYTLDQSIQNLWVWVDFWLVFKMYVKGHVEKLQGTVDEKYAVVLQGDLLDFELKNTKVQ